jgi:beta-galactosidase
VTTNFMGFLMDLHRPIDYWRWAAQQDVVSNDHYLIAADSHNEQELAMTADLTRGWAQGKPWLLMEHSTSAVNWQPRNVAKAPLQLLRNSLQHVARGADGALFFQWRASRAGAEKFHSAMLPHAGTDTKVWREVCELGRILGELGELAGSTVDGVQVAIIHDTDARWANEIDSHPSVDVSVIAETRRWYQTFWSANISTDFRQSSDDLTSYALVVVPVQYLMSDEGASNIRSYVEGGGHVVVTYFSGIVDEHDHIRLGGYPGAFRDVLGVRVEEFFPLPAGETVTLSTFGSGSVWSELCRSDGAEVLARYAEGPVAGSAAITRNRSGAGVAYYVGTALGAEPLAHLVAEICETAGVRPVLAGAPAGVEVIRRASGSTSWTFVINHTVVDVDLALPGADLVTSTVTGTVGGSGPKVAEGVSGRLTVAAGSVAVVRA